MSTKRPAPCPECGASTLPTDRAVALPDEWHSAPFRFWRYVCQACSWVWRDDLQRIHNESELQRARKRTQRQGAWDW